jgi:stage II sporulation protein M
MKHSYIVSMYIRGDSLQRDKKSVISIGDAAPFLISVIAMVTGIFFGAFAAVRLGSSDLTVYTESINLSVAAPLKTTEGFLNSLLQNVKTIALFWFLGMTVIGSIPLVAVTFYKGYAIGFTVAVLVLQYKLSGLLAAIIGVLPHSIIFIPTYIILAGLCVSFSSKLLADRKNIKSLFLSYSLRTVFLLLVIALGSAVEGYLSSWFFKIALGLAANS